MLRTRLWVGAGLILLASVMLVADRHLGPTFPFLLLFFAVLGILASLELHYLLPPELRFQRSATVLGVLAILGSNWPSHLGIGSATSWENVGFVFALSVLGVFLIEMATYKAPGGSVARVSVTVWLLAYLGFLPSFLAQLRWQGPDGQPSDEGAIALALAIFVPKFCDVGAYFTGRFLGSHPMTPVLSPKKTWEGLIGGLLGALTTAVAAHLWLGLPRHFFAAIGFGLTVGIAGVLGDLAESLIKRDCHQKDAGHAVPGFGGVLDVLDSIIFAAPVAYWWLRS